METLNMPIKGGMNSVQPIDIENLSPSTLPLALNILKNIKDLSKVRFVDKEEFLKLENLNLPKMKRVSLKLTQDDIFKMQYTNHPLDFISACEEHLVKEVVNSLNTLIDSDWYIVFYLVVSSVGVIAEGTMAPEIFMKSECFFEREPSKALI